MAIHFRHADADDLPRCVELVTRWGRGMYSAQTRDRLAPFWLRLMHGPAGVVHVFVDDALPPAQRIQGVASGACVTGAFARDMLDDPRPFVAQRLVEQCGNGALLPLLGYHDIALAQAGDGLHAVGLDATIADAQWSRPSTLRWIPVLARALSDWLGGYRLQSLHREVFGRDAYRVMRSAGGPLVTSYPGERFAHLRRLPPDEWPYLMGLTREQSRHRIASPGWMYFQAEPAQWRLTPAEQDLLLLALRGVADDEAASRLRISTNTVKARWQAVFDHVAELRQDLLPPHEPGTARGAERRRHLLACLRKRSEELRPVLTHGR
jgi:DNA-binding CsgD family transcriptional regulator